MDFTLTPEQEALRDLTREILEGEMTVERLRAAEAAPDWFDRGAWDAIARARLLGTAIPEEHGGSGLGLVELCLVLGEVGRTVAPLPVFPTLVLGALPIDAFGSDAQRRRWLPAAAAGDAILTAALVEPNADDPARPTTSARRDGTAWRLDGVKTCVPAAHLADAVIFPARIEDGATHLFVVDPRARGLTMERQVATNREPQWHVTLAGAPAERLGDGGRVDWFVDRALVGLCALQVGVADRALRMTAEYTIGREQFGRPLASFQAVHQRAADAFIDVEAIRLTCWQAAWRLAAGESATTEVAVAKFWAAEAGHRVVYAAQHLHGGIGVDVDYPLHRYYLWAKQIELTLGSATRHLARIGTALADVP